MVWGCSKICDLKKKSTTPLLDDLSPGRGVSFYKINSHIPYYAHEIFNGISLLKILTSFVVFDYKHSINVIFQVTDFFGWDSSHQRIVRHILSNNSTSGNDHVIPNSKPRHNRHITANPYIISNMDRLCYGTVHTTLCRGQWVSHCCNKRMRTYHHIKG